MSWIPDRYRELRSLLRPDRIEDDVAEELELHLQLRAQDLQAQGMTAALAREEALRRFGDVQYFRRETVAIDESILRERKRMELFDSLRRELRQGARGLLRAPGFSLVILLTLALGIGASSAVFTLLKAVVLDPLPYPAAERLVVIKHPVPGISEGAEWNLSSASYFHFKERSRALEDLAVYVPSTMNVRGATDAQLVDVISATPNLFDMLGARPVRGRLFQPADGVPEASRVALISHGYWQREFGGSAEAIGSTITFEGTPAEIVGVLQEGFSIPERPADVYIARRMNPAGPHWNSHVLPSIAKLRAGATLEQLATELASLTAELPEAYPDVYAGFVEDSEFGTTVYPLRDTVVGANVARTLWVVLGAVLVVLLIACANVANLFLVRAEARRNELAVRSALGAERAHIFLQSAVEALLLCTTAGLASIWLAYIALRALVAMAPANLPRVAEVQLSSTTILTSLALAIVAALVFALFPVVRRTRDYSALREAGRGLTASRRQVSVRAALVTAQIAFALVLLAGAGLMLRSFQSMRAVDLGFDPERVLTLEVSLPYSSYNEHERVAFFWNEFMGRVRTLSGVAEVGGTIALPMAGGHPCAVLQVDPQPANARDLGCPAYNIVTPGYFEAAGIAVRGRTPTWDDVRSGTGAVVISESLANTLWPGENAIGRGVRVPNGATEFYRIVGVADDVRARGVREPAPNYVYYPIKPIQDAPLWQAQNALVLMVRTRTDDSERITTAIRDVLRELEPAAALGTVEQWQTYVDRSMASTTFTMILLGTAGGMALLLAVIGLYGVVAYIVNRRRSEIGVRMALGADRRAVGGMVVLQSLKLGTAGVAIGLVGAALTTHALRSLLFAIEPTDALTLTSVAFGLLAVSAIAALIPARRAASVSPVDALRSD